VQIVNFCFVQHTDRGRAAKFSALPNFSSDGLSKFFRYFKWGALHKFHASLVEDSIVKSFLAAEPEDRLQRARTLFAEGSRHFASTIERAADFVLELLEPIDRGGKGLQVGSTSEFQQATRERFQTHILELKTIAQQFFGNLFGETEMRDLATPVRPSTKQSSERQLALSNEFETAGEGLAFEDATIERFEKGLENQTQVAIE
jgi:hypothetical protein